MIAGLNLDALLDDLSDRIVQKLRANLPSTNGSGTVAPRLLTVDQAAEYLGRTKTAVQHMISQRKIPVVKSDRRCFVDVRDLDRWIEDNKRI